MVKIAIVLEFNNINYVTILSLNEASVEKVCYIMLHLMVKTTMLLILFNFNVFKAFLIINTSVSLEIRFLDIII